MVIEGGIISHDQQSADEEKLVSLQFHHTPTYMAQKLSHWKCDIDMRCSYFDNIKQFWRKKESMLRRLQ